MITIIGAGPVGSYTAQRLAKKGHEVRVFEEHGAIGLPVQCTGIVTKSIEEITRIRKEFLVNRLRKVRVHAPNGKEAEVKIDDIVIDRTKFDSDLAENAKKAGAAIMLNSRVSAINSDGKFKKLQIDNTNTKKTKLTRTDILIGADGPNSIVSRHMGNKRPECWIGVQAVAKMPVDKNIYEVYFGDEIPGFFGWVVPEDESTARVGIATMKNPRKVFERFMKRLDGCRITEMQGGLIPKYDPNIAIENSNNYLVGDAATQVKATTGGGLVPGLKAAECLARAITKKSSYKNELSAVTKELKMSLHIRTVLDRFFDADYNQLTAIIGKERLQSVLNEHDRDSPSKIIFKSLIREPRLLLFSRALLRAGLVRK
jgi:geranylgeranyl reductase family protein